jgi:cytochrome P450
MRAAEVSTLGSCKITDRFDPFSADYLADPYPTLAVARDAAPAFYSADLDHWVVTRYADVRHVLRTTAEFSAINALEPLTKLFGVAPPLIGKTQEQEIRAQIGMRNHPS